MWPFNKETNAAKEIDTPNNSEEKETKSAGVPFSAVVNNPVVNSGASSFVNYLQNNNHLKLSFDKQFEYYERCEPMADAVDTIAGLVGSIPPIVVKKKNVNDRTGVVVDNHPILDLLFNPSPNKDWSDFARDTMSVYLICGSPFLRLMGDVNKPPVSLKVERPNPTRIEPNSYGEMQDIFVNDDFQAAHYIATPVVDSIRYRHGLDNEYWPMFSFNSRLGTREFYGTPLCQQLYYQIEQYLAGGLHNKSLLENGTRPGGAFSTEPSAPPLTDSQRRAMQQEIVDKYQGPANAGNPLLMEWVKYQEFLVNNRDMDYNQLMADCRTSIFRRFNIPLPSVESESQKYSNFSVSQVTLYETGVLPNLYFFFRQLKQALMYRYHPNDWQYYDITCDVSQIPALQTVKYSNVLEKSKIGIHQVNELRADLADEPLKHGDVLLRNHNDVPALADYDEGDDGDYNDGGNSGSKEDKE